MGRSGTPNWGKRPSQDSAQHGGGYGGYRIRGRGEEEDKKKRDRGGKDRRYTKYGTIRYGTVRNSPVISWPVGSSPLVLSVELGSPRKRWFDEALDMLQWSVS